MANITVTRTGTVPTVTLLLLNGATTVGGDETTTTEYVIDATNPSYDLLADGYHADEIARDTALQAALDAGEVTVDAFGVTITDGATLAKLGSGVTLDDSDNQPLSNVLGVGNTSGGNNIQMTGSDQVQFGGTANNISNGATGLLEYVSNKGHEFQMTDSVFNLRSKGKMSLADASSSKEFNIVPEAGAISLNATFVSSLDFDTALTASRSWSLPDATGTIALTSDLSAYQLTSEKDAANGYAGLDGAGKINPSQLPSIAITETFVVASQAAMLALSAQTGDIAVRTDTSSTFILQGTDPSVLGDWVELQTPTDAVSSVFGRTGVVTAQNGDYTTGQVTEVTDKNYVTDAEAVVIGNTSGSNTGDVTLAGTGTHASLVGQALTIDKIDLTADVTGTLPVANGGTGSATQNFVDLTTAQTVGGVKTLSDTLEINTTTADDNLKLEKSNSTTSWAINAGRTAFFDNWLLFKNSAEAGNYTFAISNNGAFRAKNGSAGAPAYTFDLASNYGMSLNNTNDATVLSAAGFPLLTLSGLATKRTEVRFDTLFKVGDMTTTTRDGLTAEDGDIIYNNTTDTLQARVDGAWVDAAAASPDHGCMYISTPAATTISTADTPVKVAGTHTLDMSNNFDEPVDGRLRYTGEATKTFFVNAAISMTGGNNNTYSFYIAKNGTVNPATQVQRKLSTGADVGALALFGCVSLATNDYIEIFVENNGDTTNMTAEHMYVSVK